MILIEKNSDFGLELLANQSKIKPEDNNVNLQDISNNFISKNYKSRLRLMKFQIEIILT